MGVVVRRYIGFLILLIPTLVSVLFYSSIPTFCSFKKNVFRSLYCRSKMYIEMLYTCIHTHTHTLQGVPEKRPHPLTCPQSPALELKRRHLHHPHPDKDQVITHYLNSLGATGIYICT